MSSAITSLFLYTDPISIGVFSVELDWSVAMGTAAAIATAAFITDVAKGPVRVADSVTEAAPANRQTSYRWWISISVQAQVTA